MANTPSANSRTIVLIFIAIGLAAMLASSAHFRLTKPSLVTYIGPAPQQQQTSGAPQGSQMPSGSMGGGAQGGMPSMGENTSGLPNNMMTLMADLDQEKQTKLMGMMQQLKENPEDEQALVDLTSFFFDAGQWESAQQFAGRAVKANSKNFAAHNLEAVALANLGKHAESAASFERALTLSEDAGTLFSLAVLQIYYLNEKDTGVNNLRKAIGVAGIPPDLKKLVEEELAKH